MWKNKFKFLYCKGASGGVAMLTFPGLLFVHAGLDGVAPPPDGDRVPDVVIEALPHHHLTIIIRHYICTSSSWPDHHHHHPDLLLLVPHDQPHSHPPRLQPQLQRVPSLLHTAHCEIFAKYRCHLHYRHRLQTWLSILSMSPAMFMVLNLRESSCTSSRRSSARSSAR